MVMSKPTHRSYTITERQLSALTDEAKRLGIAVSDLLRRILDDWIARPAAKK